MDFDVLAGEQILRNILLLTEEQLKKQLSQMSREQLHSLILGINEKEPHWQEKIRVLFQAFQDNKQVEEASKNLSLNQMLNLLSPENVTPDVIKKIPALFTGISIQTFIAFLKQASPAHIIELKKVAMTESLQFKLFLFCHESIEKLDELENELISIEEMIATLEPKEMGIKEKQTIENRFQSLALEEQEHIQVVDKALAIAWNSERLDVIDCLSSAKERHQKALVNLLKNNVHSETNLYKILDKHLNAIYGQPNNPTDIQALKDEDPSFEALAKFGIWYLEDYFAIGLLPNLEDARELELNSETSSEEERVEHRRLLFQSAKHELERLGLVTVADLKKASIFSKKSLLEWLQTHK